MVLLMNQYRRGRTINREQIESIFGIKECWELPERAMQKLNEDSEELFRKIMDTEPDLTDDIFREYFENNQADREKLKQDFTPACLGEVMAGMVGKGNKIADICAGTGTLTIKMWVKTQNSFFHAEEYAKSAIPLLLINLAIRNMDAEVVNKDCLTGDVYGVYRIKKGEQFGKVEESDQEWNTYDTVVMNPPYSYKWKDVDAYKEDRRFLWGLPPRNFSDYAFLMHGYSLLNPKGKLIAIVPHGLLFRGGRERDIRKRIVDDKAIRGIIGMPDRMFLNTSIPVVIMALQKEPSDSIFIMDASKDFKKEQKQNLIENPGRIVKAWETREDIDKYSRKVSVEEIKENDYNLNIPRYIDTYEKEELPPITEILRGIIRTEKEIRQSEKEMCEMLKQMYGTNEQSQKELSEMIGLWEEKLNANQRD